MFVLKCVILLLPAIFIHGEDLTEDCRFEMLSKSYEADACIAKLNKNAGSVDQIIKNFNETVIFYNGTEVDYASVDPLINKFLDVMPKFCNCVLLVFNVPAECSADLKGVLRKMFIEQISAFTYLARDDNGDKIKKLIPHNGLKVLFANIELEKCVDIVKDINNIDELCSAIGQAHQCAVNVIGSHPNENVLTTVQEIITRAQQANSC